MAEPALDVAVVGAGVIGLAIARELAGRGARVAVFERTGIGAGASVACGSGSVAAGVSSV